MNSRTPSSRTPVRRQVGRVRGTPRPAEERKEATRRAIVAAALHLLEERSFSALSLREVTREAGIVPGRVLPALRVDGSARAWCSSTSRSAPLRDMLRGARAGKLDPKRVIESSVDILIDGVNERREHWRFIGRERTSGVTVLRYAIRTEIRLITSELAIDLARFPGLTSWSSEDLNILASLFVNSMIVIAEAIEDASDPAALDEIKRIGRQTAADDRRRRGGVAQQQLTSMSTA